MNIKFLFMDEKYADQNAPKNAQTTSLTGILIPADVHGTFRKRFYGLVTDAIDDSDYEIAKWPHEVTHASKLLPDSTDDKRFIFLEGLVSLINEQEFRIYRVGYFKTPDFMTGHGGQERQIVGLCFFGLLCALQKELALSQIWPIMETDRTAEQDQSFAGLVQTLDYMTERFKTESVSVDNANLGEVLYMTKRSGYGALVDNVAYLLHVKWLQSVGHELTPYKKRLADIASDLIPAIAFDEIAALKVNS